jgi:NADH-quinone oxidoreductase subunit M
VNELLWTAQAGYPLLATLQWLPLAGALLLLIMREADLALVLGRLFAVAELVVAIDLYARIEVSTPVMQFAERIDLFGYHAAVDGISVLFILLTALLGLLLSFYGMARQQMPPVQLLSVLLIIESAQMTMLTTMNLLWFCGASAVQLALVSYLLWRWATASEEHLALSRFLQYQVFGWCLFLAGAIVLVWSHADVLGRPLELRPLRAARKRRRSASTSRPPSTCCSTASPSARPSSRCTAGCPIPPATD